METLNKIKEFQKFGSRLGLERMEKLTDLLDDPQEGLAYIHVGGTNGKGSVSNYIYSVLKANGCKVGMFTSPFMEGFRQAIVVDDIPMTESELDIYYRQIESAIEIMEEEGYESPTEFEVITVLALLYFADMKPDFVIMEVGLGGIGDSTNIIGSPLFSVITSVSLDHCDVLGDTIREIAHEKAGIIKEGVPVISNVANREAAIVIAKEAYQKKAPLIDATKFKAKILEHGPDGSKFSVDIDGINYPEMKISMAGNHQIKNAVCALTVIEQLRKKSHITLDKGKTLMGLEGATLEGRFETISDCPVIIMDGAHNAEGAAALSEAIFEFYPEKKILTVFSLMKDKDPKNVISEFLKFSDEIIIADIIDDKPIDTDKLSLLISHIPCEVFTTRNELIERIRTAEDFDMIVVTGSLYLIRDLRKDLLAPTRAD